MQIFPLNIVISKTLRFLAFVIKAEKHNSAICALLQQRWGVWLWVHPLLQRRLAVWWGRLWLWIRCEALFSGWWIGLFSSNINERCFVCFRSQRACAWKAGRAAMLRTEAGMQISGHFALLLALEEGGQGFYSSAWEKVLVYWDGGRFQPQFGSQMGFVFTTAAVGVPVILNLFLFVLLSCFLQAGIHFPHWFSWGEKAGLLPYHSPSDSPPVWSTRCRTVPFPTANTFYLYPSINEGTWRCPLGPCHAGPSLGIASVLLREHSCSHLCGSCSSDFTHGNGAECA